jgi:hypothetical protein
MNKAILTERAKTEERKDNKRKLLESKARQQDRFQKPRNFGYTAPRSQAPMQYRTQLWQNQSELHRLKYVSPLLRATSCFKRYNFLACRVTSRYTTENRIKQGTSHEGKSRDINAITLYITGRYITYAYKSNISVQRGTLLQNDLSFKSQQWSLKTRTLYTSLLQISC